MKKSIGFRSIMGTGSFLFLCMLMPTSALIWFVITILSLISLIKSFVVFCIVCRKFVRRFLPNGFGELSSYKFSSIYSFSLLSIFFFVSYFFFSSAIVCSCSSFICRVIYFLKNCCCCYSLSFFILSASLACNSFSTSSVVYLWSCFLFLFYIFIL